ncbi:hypothetical protein [Scale drop disease virus]|uniref:ORF_018L n=1 Tax=Scale drop disease virus TaxID=1697349 RepID=A0A0K1L6Q6_9VIRU|nr:ORF_018L [Scale drop disease virus]AKU37433.1 ORF_018L [Scale drop disease virus]QLI60691.1 hypothetical protein [Scale drop disease virus]QXJ13609.1 ORF018L [Scale drop disease virus]
MVSLNELKEKARALGIKGFSRLRKPELEARIAAFQQSALVTEFGSTAQCERANAHDVREVGEQEGVEDGTRAEICADLADIANEDARKKTTIENMSQCNRALKTVVVDKVIRSGQSPVDPSTGKTKTKPDLCNMLFAPRGVRSSNVIKTCIRKYSVNQLIDMCKTKNLIWHYPNTDKPLPKAQLCNLLFSDSSVPPVVAATGGSPPKVIKAKTVAGCIRTMPLIEVMQQCQARGIVTVDANGKKLKKKELCQKLYEAQSAAAPVAATSPVRRSVVVAATSPVRHQSPVVAAQTVQQPVAAEGPKHVDMAVQTSILLAKDDDETINLLSLRNMQELAMMRGIDPVDKETNKLRTKRELVVLLNNVTEDVNNMQPELPIVESFEDTARISGYADLQNKMLSHGFSIVQDGRLMTKLEMINYLSENTDFQDILEEEFTTRAWNYQKHHKVRFVNPFKLPAPQPIWTFQPLIHKTGKPWVLMPRHNSANTVAVDQAFGAYIAKTPRPYPEIWLADIMRYHIRSPVYIPFEDLIETMYPEDLPRHWRVNPNDVIIRQEFVPFQVKLCNTKDLWKEFEDLITANNEPPTEEQQKLVEKYQQKYNFTDLDFAEQRNRVPKIDLWERQEEFYYNFGVNGFDMDKVVDVNTVEVSKRYIDALTDTYLVRCEPDWKIIIRLGTEREIAETMQEQPSSMLLDFQRAELFPHEPVSPLPPSPSPKQLSPQRPLSPSYASSPLPVAIVQPTPPMPETTQSVDVPLAEFFQWEDQHYDFHTNWISEPIKNSKLVALMKHFQYPGVEHTTDMKEYLKKFTVRDFWELLNKIDPSGVVFKRPADIALFDGYLMALENMLDFIDTSTGRMRTPEEFREYVYRNPPQQSVQMRSLPRWDKVMKFIDQSLTHILNDRVARMEDLDDSQSYDIIQEIQEPVSTKGSDRLEELFTADEKESHVQDFMNEYNQRELTDWQN